MTALTLTMLSFAEEVQLVQAREDDPCRELACGGCVAPGSGCGWCNTTTADGKIEPLAAGERVCRAVQPGSADQLAHCFVERSPPPDSGLGILFSGDATVSSISDWRARFLHLRNRPFCPTRLQRERPLATVGGFPRVFRASCSLLATE